MTKLPTLPTVRDLGGDEFEKLLHQLLHDYARQNDFEYEPHGKSGAAEDGVDGLARRGTGGGLKGVVGFQFKWLTGNLSKGGNAKQIRKSLADATVSDFELNHYVLVTPENITPAQKKWLLGLSPRKGFRVHHWGHSKITSLFRISPDLMAEYYPETTRAISAKQSSSKVIAAYLTWLIKDSAPLKLRAIDQGAARSGREPLGLTSIYVDLELTFSLPAKQSLAAHLSQLKREMEELLPRRGEKEPEEIRRVPALEAAAHHPRLVLLGAPGSGKSTLTAFLALSLAEAIQGKAKSLTRLGPWWKAGPLLPVRVVLREFAASLPRETTKGRAEHLWEFLAAEWKRLGLAAATADAVRERAAASDAGALFLLDGLDEAREATTRQRVLEAVTEFAATAGPKCRFLITLRPYAWEPASAPEEWSNVYQLAEFSAPQIKTFIGHWFGAVQSAGWIGGTEAAEKIADFEQAVQRNDIEPLAANPLLLTLMATLLANRYRLPDDRADLYDEVVKLLLQRWAETTGADRGLLDALNIPGLTLDHIREVMQQLAFAAHDQHTGEDGVANIREGELLAGLRPLFGHDTGKADLALDYIEKRAGLLLGQGPRGQERQYTFPHRTFQEYLAACWLAEQPDFCARSVDLARQNPTHWREVLTFAARQAKVGRGVPAADALVHCQSIGEWSKAQPVADNDWRRAVLAGEQLLEIGLAAVNVREEHQTVHRRVGNWLASLLEKGALPVPERMKAGTVLARLGDERPGVGLKNGVPDIDWIEIPPGPFLTGEEKEVRDIPQTFAISRYPVTVAQFQSFVAQGGYDHEFCPTSPAKQIWTEADWKWKTAYKIKTPEEYRPIFQTLNHPQVGVSWHEAIAFCRWLSGELNRPVTLPSEAEWERAARHTDGREFPWGERADDIAHRCNIGETGLGNTSAVGMFPSGCAPCGAADMAGNVWEWTRSIPEDLGSSDYREFRGATWGNDSRYARCAFRGWMNPRYRLSDVGFRVVASPFSALNSECSEL